MILCDRDLHSILHEIIPFDQQHEHVNPASIDIRVGSNILRECPGGFEKRSFDAQIFLPGEFALVETYEHIRVPNGYAVELKLKSSRAREGWNHSLAFWVDPGWDGVLTMEIHNALKYHKLILTAGVRFAQLIVHQLSGMAEKPYCGRYQGAGGVEGPKSDASASSEPQT